MIPPYLSLIIPARNEESRLPVSLEQVKSFLARQSYAAEVIVVENGSTDRTLQVAQSFCLDFNSLHVIHADLPGKGNAVRLGMLSALGEYRLVADADLSMPIDQVKYLLPPHVAADIVIASREVPGARRIGEPYYRHFTGRVFNFFIRSLVLPGLQDTQCGFKSFRAPVAEILFRKQTLTGWSFDVELLVIARQLGFTIQEVGIPWYYYPGSKVNIWRHSWRMFLDLLTIRRNMRQGLYDA